jgi:glyoxylase-like metal-dependent hydrolase (beta-lactamase superfamily II)
VLSGKSASLRGGHSFFEADLLDPIRTIELPNPDSSTENDGGGGELAGSVSFSGSWHRMDELLPSVLDVFKDGSLYVVDAPGHLPGHINLLARVDDGGSNTRWVYLAGDACHDRRIMRQEREIGEWHDANGHLCCIHADRLQAEATIARIKGLEEKGFEVVFSHDVEWESDPKNLLRFFGTQL